MKTPESIVEMKSLQDIGKTKSGNVILDIELEMWQGATYRRFKREGCQLQLKDWGCFQIQRWSWPNDRAQCYILKIDVPMQKKAPRDNLSLSSLYGVILPWFWFDKGESSTHNIT